MRMCVAFILGNGAATSDYFFFLFLFVCHSIRLQPKTVLKSFSFCHFAVRVRLNLSNQTGQASTAFVHRFIFKKINEKTNKQQNNSVQTPTKCNAFPMYQFENLFLQSGQCFINRVPHRQLCVCSAEPASKSYELAIFKCLYMGCIWKLSTIDCCETWINRSQPMSWALNHARWYFRNRTILSFANVINMIVREQTIYNYCRCGMSLNYFDGMSCLIIVCVVRFVPRSLLMLLLQCENNNDTICSNYIRIFHETINWISPSHVCLNIFFFFLGNCMHETILGKKCRLKKSVLYR